MQWVDATGDAQAGLRRLYDGLRRAGLDPRDSFSWDPTRSPYPGLAPFDVADAAVFFGREPEITKLLELLQPTLQRDRGRFLMVVGPSGSGKSSLVRAGLIPRMRRTGHRWVVVPPMVPGTRPTANLARTLAAAVAASGTESRDLVAIQHRLEAGAAGLVEVLRDLCETTEGTPGRALVVVDQAEELVTRCGEGERNRFLGLLHDALSPDSPLWVVATVRSEFLSRLITDAGMADIIDEPFMIGPVSRSRLPEVIARPAQRAGLEFAPGLVERMAEDTAGGDALPLLAYTLLRLSQRAEPGQALTGRDYEAVGEVVGALTHQAGQVTAELTAQGMGDAVLPTLLRLAAVEAEGEPTRRRVPMSSFRGDATAVVRAFVDARLLTTAGRDDDATVEVAHEALLRQWTPLRNGIEASRRELELRGDIERLARDWHEKHRDESYLLRGVRLAHVAQFDPEHLGDLGELEREFLEISRQAWEDELERERQRSRRLRRRLYAAVIALVFAGAGVASALVAINRATSATRQAEDNAARAMAQQARALAPQRPALALAVAAEALARLNTPEVAEALQVSHTAYARAEWLTYVTLAGHAGPVWAVAFDPAGERIATASGDDTAKLWDAATGKELVTLTGHTGFVRGVAFDPSGERIATASGDDTAKLWDAATGEELVTLVGHNDRLWAVVFDSAGKRIATASDDGTAKVWDVDTGKELVTLDGHTGPVWAVAFDSAGERIATASEDGTASLWDAATGKRLAELTGHTGFVRGVTFDPAGERVATASNDGTVKVWDAARGKELVTLLGHTGFVQGVAFDPAGERVATASSDDTAKLWDAATGEELATLVGHAGFVRRVVFDPSGDRIATASDDGTVRLWEVSTGKGLITLAGHSDPVWAVAFDPLGERVATASGDDTAKLWDSPTGEELMTLAGHTDALQDVAFDPSGERVATASNDGTAKVWDAATGEELVTLAGHTDVVGGVAFDLSGERVATASDDGTAKVWDAATGEELVTLAGHADPVRGVAFDPGERIATASSDDTAKLWDAATGKELTTLTGHTGAVYAVALDPAGERVATASDDGTANLWDAATGERLLTLTAHTGFVRGVAFDPSGERIATASDDDTAKLWDAATGEELTTLTGHADWVRGVAFDPSGERVATASSDGTAIVRQLILTPTQACELIATAVTASELKTALGEDELVACTGLR